jgi:SAM-dependent methyltransferase
MPQKPSYYPGIFDVADLHDARRIILTPEGGLTTDERWESETPYLAGLIAENLKLSTSSVVVDYGCGVGRLAKELISRYGCRVVGVDISSNMRSLAGRYVASDKFSTCAPESLLALGEAFADAALAVWVLQHCPRVDEDLERIRRSLKINGQLVVVNENHRCLPTTRGWMSDGLDLEQILLSRFSLDARGRLDPEVMTKARSETTFWALYRAGRTGVAVTAPSSVDATAPTHEPAPASSASVRDPSPPIADRGTYPAPGEVPTQSGPKGIRFDFNDGCRIALPEGEHPWHVRLSDLDTGNILFETELKSGRVNSTKCAFGSKCGNVARAYFATTIRLWAATC